MSVSSIANCSFREPLNSTDGMKCEIVMSDAPLDAAAVCEFPMQRAYAWGE